MLGSQVKNLDVWGEQRVGKPISRKECLHGVPANFFGNREKALGRKGPLFIPSAVRKLQRAGCIRVRKTRKLVSQFLKRQWRGSLLRSCLGRAILSHGVFGAGVGLNIPISGEVTIPRGSLCSLSECLFFSMSTVRSLFMKTPPERSALGGPPSATHGLGGDIEGVPPIAVPVPNAAFHQRISPFPNRTLTGSPESTFLQRDSPLPIAHPIPLSGLSRNSAPAAPSMKEGFDCPNLSVLPTPKGVPGAEGPVVPAPVLPAPALPVEYRAPGAGVPVCRVLPAHDQAPGAGVPVCRVLPAHDRAPGAGVPVCRVLPAHDRAPGAGVPVCRVLPGHDRAPGAGVPVLPAPVLPAPVLPIEDRAPGAGAPVCSVLPAPVLVAGAQGPGAVPMCGVMPVDPLDPGSSIPPKPSSHGFDTRHGSWHTPSRAVEPPHLVLVCPPTLLLSFALDLVGKLSPLRDHQLLDLPGRAIVSFELLEAAKALAGCRISLVAAGSILLSTGSLERDRQINADVGVPQGAPLNIREIHLSRLGSPKVNQDAFAPELPPISPLGLAASSTQLGIATSARPQKVPAIFSTPSPPSIIGASGLPAVLQQPPTRPSRPLPPKGKERAKFVPPIVLPISQTSRDFLDPEEFVPKFNPEASSSVHCLSASRCSWRTHGVFRQDVMPPANRPPCRKNAPP